LYNRHCIYTILKKVYGSLVYTCLASWLSIYYATVYSFMYRVYTVYYQDILCSVLFSGYCVKCTLFSLDIVHRVTWCSLKILFIVENTSTSHGWILYRCTHIRKILTTKILLTKKILEKKKFTQPNFHESSPRRWLVRIFKQTHTHKKGSHKKNSHKKNSHKKKRSRNKIPTSNLSWDYLWDFYTDAHT